MNTKWLIAAVAVVMLAGCTEQSPDETETAMTERSTTLRTDALGREIEQARNELAERIDVNANEIEVSVAEFVTWNNGAIGCPEPGMAYTQALVPGYRVLLMADGQTYHYHGARDREPFYCPAEQAGQPLPADDLT